MAAVVGNSGSSGDIVRLAEYQVDRPTVDCSPDPVEHETSPGVLPSKIGRYTVLDLLGVGGMGVVCTAYDPKLDRKVALKLLRHKKNDDDLRTSTGRERLIREAQALAQLSHPNIIVVHDVDEFENQVYMAMEFIDGSSLDRWMVKKERGWRKVIDVFIDAAKGLAAAHEAGIIHRDFKPANVLIGKDQRVLVVDFGLAKSQDNDDDEAVPSGRTLAARLRERGSLMDVIGSTRDTKLTQVGRTVGTPAYMAPEQFLGLPVGPATDQFSFGVALFEALYGYLPFPDESRDELIDCVTEGRVTDPPKDTVVPSWVHRVVLRALRPRPDERYPSVQALIAALQADPAKRRLRVLAGVGGALLLGLAFWGVVQAVTPDQALCGGAEARMQEIWNVERKTEVKAAFEGIEWPYALDAWTGVEEELDKRASQWSGVHTAVCEATNVQKSQSSELMDVRVACLDQRYRELGALIEVFSDADDEVVKKAIRAAQSVENIEGCRTMQDQGHGMVIDDPARRERAEVIESKLAHSKAQNIAGRSEPAFEDATEALALARHLGHRPLLARALLQHARLFKAHAAEPEQARERIVEAVKLARETEQAGLEAKAWSLLIALEGRRSGGLERALALRLSAEMALARADDLRMQAAYEMALGVVLGNNGRNSEAIDSMTLALEHYRSVLGPHHTKVATALSNLGALFGRMGLHEEARYHLAAAAEMLEQIHGQHHPILGSIYLNLAGVENQSGQPEAARQQYLRAEAILKESLPAGHRRTLRVMLGLAQTERISDPQRAAGRFEEVLAILRGQKEPDLETMATTYNSLGHLQRRQAETAEGAETAQGAKAAEALRDQAFENFSSSLETYALLDGDRTHASFMSTVHLNLCLLEIDRNRATEALPRCRAAWELQRDAESINAFGVEALQELATLQMARGDSDAALAALREGVGVTPIEESVPLRISLAEALWDDSEARPEGVRLVREAQTELRRSSPDSDELRKVARWLRQHPDQK